MNARQVVAQLFESEIAGASPAEATALDRLILSLLKQTSLQSYLDSVAIADGGNAQIVFAELPVEVAKNIAELIGGDVKVKAFSKSGRRHTAFEFNLKEFQGRLASAEDEDKPNE